MKALQKITYQMKEMAKIFPLTESDLSIKDKTKIAKRLEKHCVTLSRGLRMIFTLEEIDGKKEWHLSLSRENVAPSDRECKICCRAFFGSEVPEKILKESGDVGEDPNIRHFYVKADS